MQDCSNSSANAPVTAVLHLAIDLLYDVDSNLCLLTNQWIDIGGMISCLFLSFDYDSSDMVTWHKHILLDANTWAPIQYKDAVLPVQEIPLWR